jgi:hypothetical protein
VGSVTAGGFMFVVSWSWQITQLVLVAPLENGAGGTGQP